MKKRELMHCLSLALRQADEWSFECKRLRRSHKLERVRAAGLLRKRDDALKQRHTTILELQNEMKHRLELLKDREEEIRLLQANAHTVKDSLAPWELLKEREVQIALLQANIERLSDEREEETALLQANMQRHTDDRANWREEIGKYQKQVKAQSEKILHLLETVERQKAELWAMSGDVQDDLPVD